MFMGLFQTNQEKNSVHLKIVFTYVKFSTVFVTQQFKNQNVMY